MMRLSKICYHRGGESMGGVGSLGSTPIPPQTGVDPLGGHIRKSLSIALFPWGSHRPSDDVSLHIASLYVLHWVTRRGDLR